MAHSTSDPIESIDASNSEEPVREKLEETTISPIAESGEHTNLDVHLGEDSHKEESHGSGTDEDMVVQTRAMRKRLREDEENKPTDVDSEPKPKKAGKQQDTGVNGPDATGNIEGPVKAQEPVPHNGGVTGDNGPRASTPPPVKAIGVETTSVASPTTGKRTRSEVEDEVLDAAEKEMGRTAAIATASAVSASSDSQSRASKRQRSESPSSTPAELSNSEAKDKEAGKSTTELPAKSGFANTSSASPFASVAKPPSTSGFGNTSASSPFSSLAKPTQPVGASESSDTKAHTSASAFKASGFGALAKSSSSPFNTFGSQANGSASPFGGLSGSGGGFGSAARPGGFGSALGGGSGSGGFGALGSGTKLTSFAGGSGSSAVGLPPITGLSAKPSLPFGAPAAGKETDDEAEGSATEADSEAGDAGDEPTKTTVQESSTHTKGRHEPAHVETGEENETTIFNTRAKIFAFVTDKEGSMWKERGRGVLKVNIEKQSEDSRDFSGDDPEDTDAKHKARLVMRADATNRLILNTPIQKGMLSGERPEKGRQNVMLLGLLQGSEGLQKLQLKMNASVLEDFWDRVSLLQGDD